MTTLFLIIGAGGATVATLCLALCSAAKKPTPEAGHIYPDILLIDDNVSVLGLVQMGLENEGCKVHAFSAAKEGIEHFQRHSADIGLVLLDYCMPDMNGDKVFDALRKVNPGVPVLLITGYCEQAEADEYLLDNVTGCLMKPFQLRDLIGNVREIVSRPKPS